MIAAFIPETNFRSMKLIFAGHNLVWYNELPSWGKTPSPPT
jgi:GH35 family endo-1,4-beta-xylanase